MVHLCQNIFGYLINEGYYLLSSQPTIDPNTVQMIEQNLTSSGIDVSQAIMLPPYSNSQCAMLMTWSATTMMPNTTSMMNATMTTSMPMPMTTPMANATTNMTNMPKM